MSVTISRPELLEDGDDAPFLAVEMKAEDGAQGRVLNFRTNVDDWVACGRDHPLRFETEPNTGGLKPYLHIRRDLWAKVTRALFYDLVELGEERDVDGQRMFGVMSGGEFFAMAPADYAKLGFPGADDLANMFEFKRLFEAEYRASRPVDETRRLHPGLQSFRTWLERNVQRVPVAA